MFGAYFCPKLSKALSGKSYQTQDKFFAHINLSKKANLFVSDILLAF